MGVGTSQVSESKEFGMVIEVREVGVGHQEQFMYVARDSV